LDGYKKLGKGIKRADHKKWKDEIFGLGGGGGGETGMPGRPRPGEEGFAMLLALFAILVVDIFWWIRR
jgi:hypothetical protein